ncbi:hypothetical protein PV755_28985 [Streptomyces caniscabiei]|uniref:hypothetical protein n=1 Tax=Streptomyces caniscabiei TaxID=2746961 RepID=UPI001CE1748F|nr:hypothetical protein [Streptomyces caniscabiei]MDX3512906.1 hypothetical protein [Streptomyces caniscabiei]MDX3721944.1 hypothetical protein [Streptomyces caniscabiei]WEO24896.1 hypothetical protein IHE65_17850 [Streptomyces caniscabiei]
MASNRTRGHRHRPGAPPDGAAAPDSPGQARDDPGQALNGPRHAPDHPAHAPDSPTPRSQAARHRSASASPSSHEPHPPPRPRAEVTVNELTGTVSWRTRAAALRSAGLGPSHATEEGAAPIPTHPAVVRAALGVDVGALTPERLGGQLARLGALRSAVAADLVHGTGLPTSVASRLRSTAATPAHTHALTTRHTAAATHRPPAPASAPGRRPSR